GHMVHGAFASVDHVFLSGLKFHIDYSDPTKVVLQRVKMDTTVGVVSSANPSVYGQTVIYTATVVPETGGTAIPATDTVTFTFDGTAYASVFPTTINPDGSATYTFDP